jgi:hypothetical protein
VELISKNRQQSTLNLVIIGIASLLVMLVFVPNVYAHYPDFEVKTTEDILKFCEFYYDEYEYLGLENLIQQHQNLPNLRACAILYNHVAWNSVHEGRDLVLIAEIEKYLGESGHIKERHIEEYEKMPQWIKEDAQMWANGDSTDARFANDIRSMLNAELIVPPNMDNRVKECVENICLKEGDFVKYRQTDKYANTISEKYTVKSISDKGIMIKSQTISRDNKIEKEFFLNEQDEIPDSERCCEKHRFMFSVPVKTDSTIEHNLKVIGETIYTFGDMKRQSLIATDLEKKIIVIIDKETGLMLSSEYKEKNIVTVWEKTQLTDTNVFGKMPTIHYENMIIPKWWKTTTMWFVEGHISEQEYLSALENLIARNILIV